MQRVPALLFLPLCLMLLAAPARAQVRLTETPREIVELIQAHLPAEPIQDLAAAQRIERELRRTLPEILATEGYFSPELNFSASEQTLSLNVMPGPRTLIRHIDINIEGPLDAPRRQLLIDAWPLQSGQAFRQRNWSQAKQTLLSGLLAADFRGASLKDSRAEIDLETHSADLSLTYVTGPAYHFGPLRIRGLNRYDSTLIERYMQHITPGARYSEMAVLDLQSALQGSGYFSSVRIETDPTEAELDADGRLILPVHLHLRERQPHRLSFGVGASSNTGARVEAVYSTVDLGSRAWKLNTGIRLEERRQLFYSDLFFPPALGRYQPSLGFAYEQTDIAKLQTQRTAFSLQRTHQRGAIDAKLALNWQDEEKRPQGAAVSRSQALAADGQWTWQQLDSLLHPRQGQVLQVRLGAAAKAVMSDRDFVRSYARYTHYFALGERDTLSVRAELGYTFAAARDGIPEQYLFRAGGTNSVRGYAYNSLGVQSGAAVVGGRYLGTASVEYTHWLDNSWGMALFVDAGNAGDNLDALKPKYGAGGGMRWRSPAGPIAVDLAWGEGRKTPRLHFFVAIPF